VRNEAKCSVSEQVELEVGASVPQERLKFDFAAIVRLKMEVEKELVAILRVVRDRGILQFLVALSNAAKEAEIMESPVVRHKKRNETYGILFEDCGKAHVARVSLISRFHALTTNAFVGKVRVECVFVGLWLFTGCVAQVEGFAWITRPSTSRLHGQATSTYITRHVSHMTR
jgi:hypothetical protein